MTHLDDEGACADYEETPKEEFRLLPATPAEWLAAFATVFLLWSLYCAAVVVHP